MVMVAALLRAVGRDIRLLDLLGIAALALVLNEPWVGGLTWISAVFWVKSLSFPLHC